MTDKHTTASRANGAESAAPDRQEAAQKKIRKTKGHDRLATPGNENEGDDPKKKVCETNLGSH